MQKILLLLIISLVSLSSPAQQISDTALTPELRETYIQKANAKREMQDYKGTLVYLDSILFYNQADAPILLYKGDVLLQDKQFKKAATTYSILLPLNYEPTITTINYSYALFMSHKPNRALQNASKAWLNDTASINATVNYFNAMLWNAKTKQASEYLTNIDHKLDSATVLVLQARLFTTAGNFTKGLMYYDSLNKTHPNKYYVIEYVEVLLAKKQVKKAREIIGFGNDILSPADKNYLLSKCDATIPNNIGWEGVLFDDIASNRRIENHLKYMEGGDKTYRFGAKIGYTSISALDGSKVGVLSSSLLAEEKWGIKLTGTSELRVQQANFDNGKRFAALSGKQTFQFKPHDHLMVSTYAQSELLNFTVALLNNKIRTNILGYKTNLMFSNRDGFYSEGDISKMSDGNQRNLIFASLYHIFRTEPTVKAGLNASFLHFTETTPILYFAPDRFTNTEVFVDFLTPMHETAKYYLKAQGALGVQKIETNAWQQGYRFQAEVGSHLEQFDFSVKYQTSNVQSNAVVGVTNAAGGYKFNWFTFNIKYKW